MRALTIHPGTGKLLGEDPNLFGQPLEPQPFVTSAAIGLVQDGSLVGSLPQEFHTYSWKILFREDYVDPVGRIRRGRFYRTREAENHNWLISFGMSNQTSLKTFWAMTYDQLPKSPQNQWQVLLGNASNFTAWSILAIEPTHASELSVIIRSRSMLGAIPDLDPSKVPESHRHQLSELWDKLSTEALRALPESVIETARNVANSALSAEARRIDPARESDELQREANFLQDFYKRNESAQPELRKYLSVPSCATTIARLHAEAKAPMRSEFKIPAPSELEADLAISNAARIVKVLGWTR